jgi:hypothetical protein
MELLIHNILFFVFAYGLTYVLIDSYIFSFPRSILYKIPLIKKGMECWFCSGTWCSAISYLVYCFSLPKNRTLSLLISDFLLHTLSGSVFIFFLHKKMQIMDLSIPEEISAEEFNRVSLEAESKAPSPKEEK